MISSKLIMAPILQGMRSLPPTRSLSQFPSKLLLRQAATTTVVATDRGAPGGTTLSGGAIAGIIVGSIIAVLMGSWFLYCCTHLAHPRPRGTTFGGAQEKHTITPTDRGRCIRRRTGAKRSIATSLEDITAITMRGVRGDTALVPETCRGRERRTWIGVRARGGLGRCTTLGTQWRWARRIDDSDHRIINRNIDE
jgi:hypothetical protein